MRIGVDAHIFSGKFQGSRTYLLNLYEKILEQNSEHEFTFFGHWDSNELPFPTNEKCQYVEYKTESRIKRLTYGSYSAIKNRKQDLFHSQYISPLLLPCSSIVTIHDVLFETHPQFFTKSEAIRNRILVKASAKRAKQVHVVSNYTKQSLMKEYNIPEDKIKIVPNGVDFTKYNMDNRDEDINYIASKYGLRDYILTVGRIEPRKNHLGLIRVYCEVKKQYSNIGKLVVVGKPDFGFNSVFEEIDKKGLKNDVVILEDVDDKDLPKVYKAASLFIYPSFAEGFGIPPLEAMASGVPVISSNKTAIPEVIEDAGILIDPLKSNEMKEAICKVLQDDGLKTNLINLGLKQAKKWTWENAAENFLKALSEI